MARFPITRHQAETAGILLDIVYKGVALFVVLGLLTLGFLTFLYAILRLDKPIATSVLGGCDLLLGVLLKQVYGSLFKTNP